MAFPDPRTWVAGEVLTAALLNQEVRDAFDAMSWVDVSYSGGLFTASAGSWTVASGDMVAYRYLQLGEKVYLIQIYLSTTSVSSTPAELRITLPNSWTLAGDFLATPCLVSDNNTHGLGALVGTVGNAYIQATKWDPGGNWAASTNLTDVIGQIMIQVT